MSPKWSPHPYILVLAFGAFGASPGQKARGLDRAYNPWPDLRPGHFQVGRFGPARERPDRYRLIIEDREPYRTNMGIVNRLFLMTANRNAQNGGQLSVYYWGPRTAPRSVSNQNWCGTDHGAARKFVRCIDKRCDLGRFAFIIGHR